MRLEFRITLHLSILITIIKSFSFYPPSPTVFQTPPKQEALSQRRVQEIDSKVRLLTLFYPNIDKFGNTFGKGQYNYNYFQRLPSYSKPFSLPQMAMRLPNFAEVQRILQKRDQYSIIKTARSIDESSLSCKQKKQYISKTMEMIRTEAFIQEQRVSEAQQKKRAAIIDIQRLKSLIKERNNEISSLRLNTLKQSFVLKKETLKDTQEKIKQLLYNISISNKNKLILEEKKKTSNDIKNQLQNKIALERGQLKKIKQIIEKQQSDLAKIRQILPKVIKNVQILENNIIIYNKFIQQSRSNVSILQNEIKRRNAMAKALKETYQVLEIDIQTARTNITTIEKRKTEISILLPNLQERAQIQSQKMNQFQLKSLKQFLSFLASLKVEMASRIDLQFYVCNGLNQAKPQSATFKLSSSPVDLNDSSNFERVPSFFVPSRKYLPFLQRYYQINQTVDGLLENAEAVITPLRILDRLWSILYGKPYKQSSYIETTQFLFDQDFKCWNINEKDVDYLSGVIKRIQGKLIIIQRQGENITLKLAACSRIDIINGKIPLAEKKIYFRGKRTGISSYNLYEAITI